MTVAVHLFARARELAGTDLVRLELTNGSVAEVRNSLAGRYPQMVGLISCSAVAVNGEYAAGSRQIGSSDEIALIPPVSGG